MSTPASNTVRHLFRLHTPPPLGAPVLICLISLLTICASSVDRRLRVLARLRGKDPTPEPEPQPQLPRPPQPPPPGGSGAPGDPSGSTGRLQQVQSWR